TWMNGQNRQKTTGLISNQYVTASLYLDGYYNSSFAHPLDHTIASSAVVGRDGEFMPNLVSLGMEVNWHHAVGRLLLEFGPMLTLVQETDGSVQRGHNVSTDVLQFIREATVGYHWDVLHGVQFETGIFMSYIG